MASEEGYAEDEERQPEQQLLSGQPSTSAPGLPQGKLSTRVQTAFKDLADDGALSTSRLEDLLASLSLSSSKDVYKPVLASVAGSNATKLSLEQT